MNYSIDYDPRTLTQIRHCPAMNLKNDYNANLHSFILNFQTKKEANKKRNIKNFVFYDNAGIMQ